MEALTEKVGYTGHRYDSDTGLTYAGARMYDPSLGRFMGIDPVGALEGVSQLNNPAMFNRYAYANNNPYKYVDPDGRLPVLIPVFVFVAKEVAGELFEHTTGFPAPTLKNAGKLLVKKGLKNQVKKGAKELTKQQQKGIRSLEKRISEHEEKLQNFKDNPTVRPGMENLPKEVIKKQQQRRVEHLETEIKTFKNNIEKIKKGESDT